MNPLFLNRLRVSDNRVFSIFFFFFDRLKQTLHNKTKLLLGRCYTELLNRDREPPKEQSTDTTKVPLDEPMSLLGVIYGNMGEELLTGTENTQRELCLQSPPQYG